MGAWQTPPGGTVGQGYIVGVGRGEPRSYIYTRMRSETAKTNVAENPWKTSAVVREGGSVYGSSERGRVSLR